VLPGARALSFLMADGGSVVLLLLFLVAGFCFFIICYCPPPTLPNQFFGAALLSLTAIIV